MLPLAIAAVTTFTGSTVGDMVLLSVGAWCARELKRSNDRINEEAKRSYRKLTKEQRRELAKQHDELLGGTRWEFVAHPLLC